VCLEVFITILHWAKEKRLSEFNNSSSFSFLLHFPLMLLIICHMDPNPPPYSISLSWRCGDRTRWCWSNMTSTERGRTKNLHISPGTRTHLGAETNGFKVVIRRLHFKICSQQHPVKLFIAIGLCIMKTLCSNVRELWQFLFEAFWKLFILETLFSFTSATFWICLSSMLALFKHCNGHFQMPHHLHIAGCSILECIKSSCFENVTVV